MSPKWTQAQQAAIQDRGGALLVSAAAGSGKTAVLTERAVQLITDPVRPAEADRLLIVTFTNAAAAELRGRIGQALLHCCQSQPGNARLRRQRMLLQRAPICTIDAFCLDLLRRHFSALDIPPDFTAADAGSIKALRDEALAETLEAAYQNPDFCAFADLYGKGRSDTAAGGALLQAYDFLRTLPDYGQMPQQMLAPWRTPHGFAGSCWHTLLLQAAARTACSAAGLLASALQDCRLDLADARAAAVASKKTEAAKGRAAAAANDKFAEPLARLEQASGLLREAAALAQGEQWDALYALLCPYAQGTQPMPGLKGMKKRLAGEHREAVKRRADEAARLFAGLLELVPCSLAEAEQDRCAAAPLLAALFAAVQDFDARLAAKKQEHKLLEFSDFEHMALRLLRTPEGARTALCEQISSGYDAVMVDEYQDTNALQDALYRCLANPAGDNLFLVGDLKQSIYRFRQADPSIFRQKLDAWPPLAPPAARPWPQNGAGAPAVVALDANFRSAPAVVDGINYLFGRLMTPRLGDVAYGEGQRLVCGAPGAYAGGVQAAFLPGAEPEQEAAWVAAQIRQMVQQGMPVRDAAAPGGVRPVRYEDCCILLSARARFALYGEALAAQGVPVYADAADDLLNAPHIRPLIALLRVIDNPARDIDLAAAMLGPLFGFSDDDLVRLRAGLPPGQNGPASLYGAVVQTAAGPCEQPYALRVRAFYQRLCALRRLSRSVPVERLLEEIFASTGYLAALGAMENGARRREDARRFAAFCATVGAGGIAQLVRGIQAAADAGGYTDNTPGAVRPGCVAIMTIHRSKGLQFPVVFLADTTRRFNLEDVRRPVLLHRQYGVGLRLHPPGAGGLYKTAAYAALDYQHRQETRSEQMRLLYVALTRAQDRLVLTLPLPGKDPGAPLARAAAFLAAGAADTLHERAGSFADWLYAALLPHPDGGPLRRLAGLLELPWADTASHIEITVEQPLGPAAAPPPAQEAPQPDEALARALYQGFGWQYPAAALAGVPAKVSVTGIVHKTEATALQRPAFLAKDGLTGAEKGSALHAFMQHADFAALARAAAQGTLAAALRAEAQRQCAAALCTEETLRWLDYAQLQQFFAGEAFARVQKAQTVLREYPFITALPAQAVLAAQNGQVVPPAGQAALAGAQVLVQGIADLVLLYPGHIELLDYKTDHGKSAQQLLAQYRPQLDLYALVLQRRFAPRRVAYKGIYSFALGRLIDAGGQDEK